MKKIASLLIFALLLFGFSVPSAHAEVPLVEWKSISDKDISPQGKAALSLRPTEWKHAETEHFIYHFSDEKAAETVYVHAEVYYGWVKEMFGVAEDSWKKKAHIFVFENEAEWKTYSAKYGNGIEGTAFTTGWELFLYRDPFYLSPRVTLAHEITHVILFRFLKGPIPLSLNEGFAEFMSYKALAMQEGRGDLEVRALQLMEPGEYIPVFQMGDMKDYPRDKVKIFYKESELFTRYLILNWGGGKFYEFLQKLSQGKPMKKALAEVYDFEPAPFEDGFKAFALKA